MFSKYDTDQRESQTFVGHSATSSMDEAIADAAQQARGQTPDAMVEFSVVGIRGRIGGIGGLRDLWVEIRVGAPGSAGQHDEPNYTTMAIGEEGGDEDLAGDKSGDGVTTMALGEEGGDEVTDPGSPGAASSASGGSSKSSRSSDSSGPTGPSGSTMTTMALGEEGGAEADPADDSQPRTTLALGESGDDSPHTSTSR